MWHDKNIQTIDKTPKNEKLNIMIKFDEVKEKIHKSTIYTGHKFLTMHKKILIVGSSGSGKSNVLFESDKPPTRYW